MFESFFIFDGKFYKQCDDVAMGSPSEPTLANIFMCHFENIWLGNYPSHLFIDGLLMINFYYFDQRITLRNLEIIPINNVKTYNLHQKLKKMVRCHF